MTAAQAAKARQAALEAELLRRKNAVLSSPSAPAPSAAPSAAPTTSGRDAPAVTPLQSPTWEALRCEGNAAHSAGDSGRAVKLYTEALQLLRAAFDGQPPADEAAKLFANRGAAQLQLGAHEAVVSDCTAALALSPGHAKALYRLATAQCALKHYRLAVEACRAGQAVERSAADRSGTFQELLNRVSTAAALDGSIAAFDGRTLHVRSAGEEAWLCRIAPATPEEEAEAAGQGALLAGEELELWSGAAAVGGVDSGALQVARAEAESRKALRLATTGSGKPPSFRCLQDALAAAHDGDRIVVLLGHHNLAGTTAEVCKRVLIRGEGRLGQTTMEQRSNSPLMRFTSPAVVQNLSLDLCGFRECVLAEGDARCTPLVEGCMLRCSGSHSIVVAGAAQPVFRDCDIGGNKAGVFALENGRPRLERCLLSGCGEQGVLAQERACITLEACTVKGNEAEGVVSMENASVQMGSCMLLDNKGPAVDVSGTAHAHLRGGEVVGNLGGVFLWDSASAKLEGVRLRGGVHHALLAGDDGVRCVAHGCNIEGDTMESRPGALRLEHKPPRANSMRPAAVPATLPPEAGCFKFEADRFTRKQ